MYIIKNKYYEEHINDMKELADKFEGQLEITKIDEIRITHPDKEIHPQILFNYYTEIFGLGYNIKVNVI